MTDTVKEILGACELGKMHVQALRRLPTKVLVAILYTAAAFVSSVVYADCLEDAGRRYHVNADLLRAIAYYESGFNPRALHHNHDGSFDIGLMQINSVHLPELAMRGIDSRRLNDASINANTGAELLRRQIDRYGATWRAVGAYHSRTPVLGTQYARAIHDIYLTRAWETKASEQISDTCALQRCRVGVVTEEAHLR